MANLRLKNWFFKITQTALKKGVRLRNGDRPDQSTFEDLLTSSIFKAESNDRAKEDTGVFMPGNNGHVVAATDAQAKANEDKPTDRTLVVQPSQLPTVDTSEAITISSGEVTLALANEKVLTIEKDTAVNLRSAFILTWTTAFKSWLQRFVTYTEGNINSINQALSGAVQAIAQNTQNIATNTQNIAALSPGGTPAIVPVGSPIMWLTSSVPIGYLALNGQEVDQTVYPVLFSIIGTTYSQGNETSGFFRLPDMRGQSPRGYTGNNIVTGVVSSTQEQLGKTYGQDKWNIDVNSVPYHTHAFSATTSEDGRHGHSTWTRQASDDNGKTNWLSQDTGSSPGDDRTTQNGEHRHSVSGTTSNNVSRQLGHPSLPPVMLVNFIIKHD